MNRVIIESPFSASNGRTLTQNIQYARLCALDCVRRGEAPYASHLIMTQFLDDSVPEERRLGMEVGFTWGEAADIVAVYEDFGVSSGMKMGVANATRLGKPVEYRNLPADLLARCLKETVDE